jgi:putative DNA primase/helicase
MLNQLQAPLAKGAVVLPAAARYLESVSEDEAGVSFAQAYAGLLRYDERQGSWFAWSGFHWKITGHLAATELVRNYIRALSGHVAGKAKDAMGRAAFAERVERVAKTNPFLLVGAEKWDADPYKLGTPGGTIDLKSGMLSPADAADLITKTTLVSPSRNEDCPRWLKFLHEATCGDAELIRFLKQFCGYSLTGDVREHVLAFAHGDGGNGKGTFIRAVTSVLKDYAAVAPMAALTESKSERHETELVILDGKRLVTASETNKGSHWNESRVKQLTGGDAITARRMRQDHYTFEPTHKLLVIGNHPPSLRGVGDAWRRRLRIIGFNHKPLNVDTSLDSKLIREAAGILRWMINGALDWQKTGELIMPKSVQLATDDFLAGQDVLAPWLTECCEVGPTFKAKASDVRASWKAYAEAAGVDPSGLNEGLRGKGYHSKRGTGGTWVYIGFRLKDHS